jgi:hypothetical protein
MLRVRWRAAGGGTDPVVRVRDVHRSTETWADVLSGDAQGRYRAGPDGWPVDGRGVAAGDTLIVRGLPFEGWNWTHAAVEPRMPAPPFAGMRSAGDTLHFVDAIPLSADAAGEARFVVAPGINLLVGDALGTGLIVKLAANENADTQDSVTVRQIDIDWRGMQWETRWDKLRSSLDTWATS